MKGYISALVCVIILLTLSACGPKRSDFIQDTEAEVRWRIFEGLSSKEPAYDVLSGSLRFGPASDTRRVTYLLWSGLSKGEDASKNHARAVRLEISAGIGVTFAKALFSDRHMTIVIPQEKNAFIGRETEQNISALLGLPLPMSMERLNDFLAGRYLSALDATAPERYESEDGGDIVYRYETNGLPAELTLNAQALPVRWKLAGHWDLTIGYDEELRPYKLDGRMQSTQGELRMVLLVKERRQETELSASSLILDIPTDFRVYDLDQ